MAVLWKEAARPERVADEAAEAEPLEAPFDVITYAGPITMAGYERLSELLETRKTHAKALVVLETPGGDPHAAFRIARAIGCHYEEFHALVPRYCKSAGTLIVVGAAVLHMDDRAELGPLDMQVPRSSAIAGRSSALDYIGVLDFLRPHHQASFSEILRGMIGSGLSTEIASEVAAKLVSGLFRPLAEQVNPHRLLEMERAMAVAGAYGARLCSTGRNIDEAGVIKLASAYPSHAFVIDRREARRLFRDVLSPSRAVRVVMERCRAWIANTSRLKTPIVDLQPFPPTDQESSHVQGPAEPHDHPGKQAGGARARDGALSRLVRHGPEADLGVAQPGRTASDAAPVAGSQFAVSDLH